MRKISPNVFKPVNKIKPTPVGNAGYDNPRENLDPHIKTKVISTKEITSDSINLLKDNSDADTPYVPMVLYNTDDTPPTASNYPIGTIYIQYTA